MRVKLAPWQVLMVLVGTGQSGDFGVIFCLILFYWEGRVCARA